MNETLQQIVAAVVPLLGLFITAAGTYLVALFKQRTAQIEKGLDSEKASKYIDLANAAVEQSVAFVAQTFVDALKADNAFTLERQVEAFNLAKNKVAAILGATAIAALNEIYGDFDEWLETKIEQDCRKLKTE